MNYSSLMLVSVILFLNHIKNISRMLMIKGKNIKNYWKKLKTLNGIVYN